MSIIQSDKRELNVEVTLSAVGMTQIGSEIGTFSFSSILPDPQNINPLNLLENVNSNQISVGIGISQNKLTDGIKQLPFLNSAYSSKLLTKPNASLCTFAYGSIDDNYHPIYDLLRGPSSSTYSEYNALFPSFGSTSASYKKPNNPYPLGLVKNLEPFVPFISFSELSLDDAKKNKTNPFYPILKYAADQNRLPTYNIWNVGSVQDVKKGSYYTVDAIRYEGPKPQIGSTTQDFTLIKTTYHDLDGSRIYVNSNNSTGMIKRIFPVSLDYIYTNPLIVYPTRFSSATADTLTGKFTDYGDGIWYDQILASGSDNCGFYMKFQNIEADGADSSIEIILEDENTSIFPNTVNYLSIILRNLQKPIIRTKYVKNNRQPVITDYTELYSPIFKTGEKFEVYVHFVGPVLLVGFESDSTKWNKIVPEDRIVSNKVAPIDFSFRKKYTYIKKIVSNVKYSFQYSAILFNNYSYPEIPDINDTNQIYLDRKVPIDINWYNYNNPNGLETYSIAKNSLISMPYPKNTVVLDFLGRADESDTIDEIAIAKNINDNIFMSTLYSGKYNSLGSKPVSAYLDWRNVTFGLLNFDSIDIQDKLSLSYVQIASSEDTFLYADQNILQNWGKILFNGTIEGPIFFGTLTKSNTFNRSVDFLYPIENGDISSYVSSIEVNCRAENANNSFVNRSATVTLNNLDSSRLGWRILELIEHNVIVVTVKAGYNNEIHTFFQGAITNIETSRTGSQSNTALTCQDLSSYLLENLYYEAVVPYSTLTFKDCIRGTMIASGFHPYYKVLNEKNIGNLNLRFSDNAAANQDSLVATIYDTILDKLNIFLSKLVKIPTTQNPNEGQGVFRWEPDNGFILDARYATGNIDKLKFSGIGIDNRLNSLPSEDSSDPGWHGVLTGDFTINTNTAPLSAIVQTFGSTLLQGYKAERTDFTFENKALSKESLDDVVQALRPENQNNTVPNGYIGFRKKVMDALEKNEIFDEIVLKFKHEQNEKIVRIPFHTLTFNCYVTKPLIFHGTFIIVPFVEGAETVTDKYIYDSINYTINKSQNLITARVSGVRQPWTIKELEMRNR